MEDRDSSVHKNIKLPSGLVKYTMEDIAENGEHRNFSEYVTFALHEYIEKRKLMKAGYVTIIERSDKISEKSGTR